MTRAATELAALAAALQTLGDGARQPEPPPIPAELEAALHEVARRLAADPPYGDPFYLGHMIKPPHPVARLAYALALWLNPNNHAFDAGAASSRMELEAVRALAALFGWPAASGHLCSGGTVANLEALWIARQAERARGSARPAVAASAQAHYCQARAAAILDLPFYPVPVDGRGRLSVGALEALMARVPIGIVVATLGTPLNGAVDPLADLAALCAQRGVRLHADAAYGGYFRLAENLEACTSAALAAATQAASIAIDPHKHGLQPYGCGAIVLREADEVRHYAHAADYAYQASDEPHLGRAALECSRPGAAAVALWATLRLLPLERGGVFAQGLAAGRRAALGLWRGLREIPAFCVAAPPELDVVVWAVRARCSSAASAAARQVHAGARAAGVHLSLARLPQGLFAEESPVAVWDEPALIGLRACLMKPVHEAALPALLERLAACAAQLPRRARVAGVAGAQ
jgi:tyrosine decarboxylase/aspartate 1-decarboxylase